MKILFLVDQLHKCGGLERVLSHKLNFLHKNQPEIEITVCTNEQLNKDFFFNIPKVINCIDLSANYRHDISLYSFENLKKVIPHYLKLKKITNDLQPDVIVHCGFGFDFYFLPLISGNDIKLIKENHSSRWFEKQSSFNVKRFFEKKYTINVFLSKEEEGLAQLNNSKVIPNPTLEISDSLIVCNKKPVIIAAGRIAPVKGFERLIDAWALIEKNSPEWRLHIYGDGDSDYVNTLEAKISEMGLDSTIVIYPAINDIQNKIADASIYAMTSHTECFPMVLLEAMQCKTPIVAFDCPTGPRSIITKNTGVLVENGNVNSFANKLTTLIDDSDLRTSLAENAFKYVNIFDINNVMKRWLELYGYQHD
jgi:glycosyltransferase involved in cell wall biosynthesis